MDKLLGSLTVLVMVLAFNAADGPQLAELGEAQTFLAPDGDIQAPLHPDGDIQAPYQSSDDIQAPAQGGGVQVPYYRADI